MKHHEVVEEDFYFDGDTLSNLKLAIEDLIYSHGPDARISYKYYGLDNEAFYIQVIRMVEVGDLK